VGTAGGINDVPTCSDEFLNAEGQIALPGLYPSTKCPVPPISALTLSLWAAGRFAIERLLDVADTVRVQDGTSMMDFAFLALGVGALLALIFYARALARL
jgi:hypothetical protein